jgi:hypothetical protein
MKRFGVGVEWSDSIAGRFHTYAGLLV